MKAIILAAGMGTRLGHYTKDLPKGMLQFKGKPLIQWQVETLRSIGLNDIIIVRGYKPETIKLPQVTYLQNDEYSTTNMVATLMCARDQLLSDKEGALVCYSDIIYEAALPKKLLTSNAEVNVLVDDEWQEYWKARLDNWQSDIESLQFDAESRITEIGNPKCSLDQAMSRYVGMIKFSAQGLKSLVNAFDSLYSKLWTSKESWRRSADFKRAYMTCMLQELIEGQVEVKAVHVNHGWLEFDTVEDYEKAVSWEKEGTLKRFIALP